MIYCSGYHAPVRGIKRKKKTRSKGCATRPGEYIGVGGPAKGMNLSAFGQKLSALKDAATKAGTTAEYYLEKGTSKEAIDLAKKILGDKAVVVYNVTQKKSHWW